MKHDSWMPLYVGDYLADTGHLNAAEHGAYLLFMMHAWRNDGAIPANDRELQRLSRMTPKQWMESHVGLLSFWTKDGDVYRQTRLSMEIEKARQISDERKEIGRKGGQKSASKRQAIAQANAPPIGSNLVKQNPTQSQSQELQPPLTPPTVPVGFARFWAAYPGGRRKAKADCIRLWLQNHLEPIADAIVAHVEALKVKDRDWRNGYVCNAAVYLRGKRWQDGIPGETNRADEHAKKTAWALG